jgi:hypothetical protein
MSAKKVFACLSSVMTALVISITVSAASFTVPESYITEQEISIFTYGNPTDAAVTVSGEEAIVTRNGHLSDMGGFIRTTLLVDISTSIPKDLRPAIIEYINGYIADLSENEELKIVTFGEKTVTLADFTNDRYDLSTAAEKIEFNGSESHIYDTTYNTIPGLSHIDNKPCFYRTLIITDGADESDIGVTREELYIRLRDEHYPIDVIAVNANTEKESDKNLVALTRMSGGRTFTLNPETTIKALADETKPGDIYYLSAVIPDGFTDGSVRQVSVTAGSENISFDIKIPVFKAITDTQTAKATEETTTAVTTAAVTTTASVIESIATTETGEKSEININLIIIIAAGVIALGGIIAIILIAVKNKKMPECAPVIQSSESFSRDETEIIAPGIHPAIILRNQENPEKVYNIKLQSEIIIGRGAECQVHLDDKSVSHNQCRIYIQNDYIVIENLSRSNITKLNNNDLNSPKPLKKDDKIKCGRVVLSVESIKDTGSDVGTQLLNV